MWWRRKERVAPLREPCVHDERERLSSKHLDCFLLCSPFKVTRRRSARPPSDARCALEKQALALLWGSS